MAVQRIERPTDLDARICQHRTIVTSGLPLSPAIVKFAQLPAEALDRVRVSFGPSLSRSLEAVNRNSKPIVPRWPHRIDL
jgi:hypothetical protein